MSNSKRFPHFKQQQSRECGAVCLRMIAKYYGRLYPVETLLELSRQREEGATLLGISEAAEAIGMHTVAAKLTFERLIDDIPLPGIAYWKGNHFVVIVEAEEKKVVIADPAYDSVVTVPKAVFLEGWVGNPNSSEAEGVVLLLEPMPEFEKQGAFDTRPKGILEVWHYFTRYKGVLITLFAGMAFGLFLMFLFPFIVQTLVDRGIEHKDPNLLVIFLIAWVMLFVGKVLLDMAGSFLTFHLGSKVNIRFITSFMQRIMHLPLRFFRSRMPEDIMQLFYDNTRVQRFLTTEFFGVMHSGALLLLLSIVLLVFSLPIFLVFIAFTMTQALAVMFFLKKRKIISYERHELAASHYSKLQDIIRGISDIRLNDAVQTQRWTWEKSEAQLYRVNKRIFNAAEFSRQIPVYLGELRNVFLIFLAAWLVVNGSISVGVLVAIVFVLMQVSNPFKQVIEFLLAYQETLHAIRRMDEIKGLRVDEPGGILDILPRGASIKGDNISFRYEGENSPWVIRNLDFIIEYGKTTAVIGSSGCGKSTLLNLILKSYLPDEGLFKIGDFPLNEISESALHEKFGVVQQDGHIFYDSIARNIALGSGAIDSSRLMEAARIAHVFPFLERFKEGFKTLIGDGGVGLSKGQKQCILIARALYRNPDYLFLDEATTGLDVETEQAILENINEAFLGKTIVIFANRMPPSPNIDHVIPLAVPRIRQKEQGELSSKRGKKQLRGYSDSDKLNLPS